MTRRNYVPLAVSAAAFLMLGACGQQDAEPVAAEDPAADAISPADGDTVSNPIAIEFGIEGMSVVAAGVNEAHSGHHHLLVDTGVPDTGLPVPADANHIHFGDASTATELTLAPGEHTLRLLLGDHLHIPHDPPVVSDPITITVE